jgi:hypothetical protein
MAGMSAKTRWLEFVTKIHHKHRSAFVGYLYILDQINARNYETH